MIVGYGKRGSKVNVVFQVDYDGVHPDYSTDTATLKGSNRFKLKKNVSATDLTFVSDASSDWVSVGDKWVFEDDASEELTVASINGDKITVSARGTNAKTHEAGEFMYFKVFSTTPTMTVDGIISFVIPQDTSKKIKSTLYCVLYRKAGGAGEAIGEPPHSYYEVTVDGLVAVTI